MDVTGFLALLHQLFPGFPVALITVIAVVVLAITLAFRNRERDGQRINATLSMSSEPVPPLRSASEPQKPRQEPQGPTTPIPQQSTSVEVSPTISPSFAPVFKTYIKMPRNSPLQAPAMSTANPSEPRPSAPPEERIDTNANTVTPPTDTNTGNQVDNAPPAPLPPDELSADGKSVELPSAEMHQLMGPVIADAPHLKREGTNVTNSPSHADSELGSQPDLHEAAHESQNEPIVGSVTRYEPLPEPVRATSSGRLLTQRSDAQTALRMMSSITQKTYVYVRATRRDAVAQKPFANELRSVRLLEDYVTFVRPRLVKLNRSLNRLGISWDKAKSDPRWAVFAYLDPFSPALVERSPVAMRDAMVSASQKVAEGIRALGYVVDSERRWGPGGALFYSLDDRAGIMMNLDEVDWTDSDIDEADADFDEDGEDLGV